MQLSTKIYSHVIITYTKSHHFITQEQNVYLMKIGIDGQIIINGNAIKARNIAEILTIKKYYETYPEKQSILECRNFSLDNTFKNFRPIKRERALKSLINGLQSYINSSQYQGSKKPLKLLEIMQLRQALPINEIL